jgi:DNA-binding protein HU-beta
LFSSYFTGNPNFSTLPSCQTIKYTGRQAFDLLHFAGKLTHKGERMNKTELLVAVANQSGLEKKQVSAVLDALNDIVYKELKAQNEVVVPGLLKLSTVTKPAQPEREGINPFTKEKTMFKAKPERKVIKARPVKALKDAV